MAASHYQELLEQHPFSDLAEVARLRIAHAYYLNHNFDRAIAAFDDSGNEILRFGGYGNRDSEGPGEDSLVKTPEIPLSNSGFTKLGRLFQPSVG